MSPIRTAPELRTFAPPRLRVAEVDATANLATLVGRAVPYNALTSVGWYLEQMAPGVFDKSTRQAARGLPLLLWHDDKQVPIGLSAAWDSRADGLWGEWTLDDTAAAQDAARAARDGRMGWLSVGFMPLVSEWKYSTAAEWDPDNVSTLDQCTRVEARLIETSLVSTPAYAEAEVTEVRTGEYCRRSRRGAPSGIVSATVQIARPPELDELARWRASITPTEQLRSAAETRR
jgi:HK97 family phage prohead protease